MMMVAKKSAKPVADADTKPSVAVYVRKSNDDRKGETQSASVRDQKDECLALAERLGYTIHEDDIYDDDGISGRCWPEGFEAHAEADEVTNAYIASFRKKRRPGFGRLCKAIHKGRYDLVICRDITRIARPKFLSDLSTWIPNFFHKHKVNIHSICEGLIQHDNHQMLIMRVMRDAMVDEELTKRAKQSADSKRKSKEGGKYITKVPPFGLKREGKNFVIDPEKAAITKQYFEHVANGGTVRQFCLKLNKEKIPSAEGKQWANGSINGLIRNPVVAGMLNLGTWKNPNWIDATNVEPIIAKDLFFKVRKILLSHLGNPNRSASPQKGSATGIIFCGVCGKRMNYRIATTKRKDKHGVEKVWVNHWYSCPSRDFDGAHREIISNLNASCLHPFLDAFVMLRAIQENKAFEMFEQRQKDLPILIEQLAKLNEEYDKLMNMDGIDVTVLRDRGNALNAKRNKVKEEMAEIRALPVPQRREKAGIFIDVAEMNVNEKRLALRDVLKKIVVYNERVEFTLQTDEVFTISRTATGPRGTGKWLPPISVSPGKSLVGIGIDLKYHAIDGTLNLFKGALRIEEQADEDGDDGHAEDLDPENQ